MPRACGSRWWQQSGTAGPGDVSMKRPDGSRDLAANVDRDGLALRERQWGKRRNQGGRKKKATSKKGGAHRFERIVLLGSSVILALALLGLQLKLCVPLKVLQRDVKVKGLVALLEADADRAALTALVLDDEDKVPAAVRHRLDNVTLGVVLGLGKELPCENERVGV